MKMRSLTVAVILVVVSALASASSYTSLSGWRVDDSAAVVGNDNHSLLVVFLPGGHRSVLVFCSGHRGLQGDSYIGFKGVAEDLEVFSGRMDRISDSTNCWSGSLARSVLRTIKRKSIMIYSIDDGALSGTVSLKGSADALNGAWLNSR